MDGQQCPVSTLQQAPTVKEEANYEGWKAAAGARVAFQEGEEVTITRGQREAVTWMVVPASHPDVEEEKDADGLGLKAIRDVKIAGYDILLAHHFLHIMFKDWKAKLEVLNDAVEGHDVFDHGAMKVRPFTESEFLIGLGVVIVAAGYNCKGGELWKKEVITATPTLDITSWQSIIQNPDFGQYM